MEKEIKQAFAERLKRLRSECGLTKEQMAENLDLTYNAYVKIENTYNNPSLKVLLKIAEYFSVSLDYLMGLSDVPTPSTKKEVLILPEDYPPAARTELMEYAKYLYQKQKK